MKGNIVCCSIDTSTLATMMAIHIAPKRYRIVQSSYTTDMDISYILVSHCDPTATPTPPGQANIARGATGTAGS